MPKESPNGVGEKTHKEQVLEKLRDEQLAHFDDPHLKDLFQSVDVAKWAQNMPDEAMPAELADQDAESPAHPKERTIWEEQVADPNETTQDPPSDGSDFQALLQEMARRDKAANKRIAELEKMILSSRSQEPEQEEPETDLLESADLTADQQRAVQKYVEKRLQSVEQLVKSQSVDKGFIEYLRAQEANRARDGFLGRIEAMITKSGFPLDAQGVQSAKSEIYQDLANHFAKTQLSNEAMDRVMKGAVATYLMQKFAGRLPQSGPPQPDTEQQAPSSSISQYFIPPESRPPVHTEPATAPQQTSMQQKVSQMAPMDLERRMATMTSEEKLALFEQLGGQNLIS